MRGQCESIWESDTISALIPPAHSMRGQAAVLTITMDNRI